MYTSKKSSAFCASVIIALESRFQPNTGNTTAHFDQRPFNIISLDSSRDASRDVTVAATVHTARQGQRRIYLNKTKLILI